MEVPTITEVALRLGVTSSLEVETTSFTGSGSDVFTGSGSDFTGSGDNFFTGSGDIFTGSWSNVFTGSWWYISGSCCESSVSA